MPVRGRSGRRMECALAIGGVDPGGGAGLAADLRAFAAAGVFGCAAVAVVTVQSTAGLRAARALAATEVVAQAREVLLHQRVRALKIGALGSAANVRAVAELLSRHSRLPAVVDPVMAATRGDAALLPRTALEALKIKLIPRATLVMANVAEAEILTGRTVANVEGARRAALEMCAMGARSAMVKGGHLRGANAIDVLVVGGRVVTLSAARIASGPLHGAGCTFASLVAGRLAKYFPSYERDAAATVEACVRWAKSAHHAALARARDVGGEMRVIVF